jgi:tetratricopeptide (TPR) repeat protein
LQIAFRRGQHAKIGTITIDGAVIDWPTFRETIELARQARELLQRAFDRGTTRVDVLEALARAPGVEAEVRRRAIARALEISSTSAWANFLRGMECVQRKDYAPAARHLEAAMRADPDRGEWRNELGSVYMNQERYREAIEQLHAAVRLKPSYASSWYNLGMACFRLNDRRRAVEAYRRFLEIEPHSTDAMDLRRLFPEL